MKVSYLITCSTETDTLERLLAKVTAAVGTDEVVILQDSTNKIDVESKTWQILNPYLKTFTNVPEEEFSRDTLKYWPHPLNKNYGAHKNFGIEKCSGDFIFQIDGDELPPDALLGENLHALLESNPTIEAYAVPRLNDFKGVTEAHAAQWGWQLSYNARPAITDKYFGPFVNWPDYQFRIFKRDYPRISFLRRLHEKIEGYASYVALPASDDYALYHDKTIETQIQTNLRYNEWFTQAENKGHTVFAK